MARSSDEFMELENDGSIALSGQVVQSLERFQGLKRDDEGVGIGHLNHRRVVAAWNASLDCEDVGVLEDLGRWAAFSLDELEAMVESTREAVDPAFHLEMAQAFAIRKGWLDPMFGAHGRRWYKNVAVLGRWQSRTPGRWA